MECNRCEYQEECDNDKNFVCPNDDVNPVNSEAYMLEDE